MPLFFFSAFRMNIQEQIKSLVESFIESEYFVLDILFQQKLNRAKLTVLVDGDQGIGIDKCAEISRHLAEKIEELNLIDSAYILEVSSPGADKPLIFGRQYLKNIGRQLKVQLNNDTEQVGLLQAIDLENQTITFLPEMKGKKEKKNTTIETIKITLAEIKKASILISFK